MDAAITQHVRPRSQIGHFLLHYGEMCLPMCIGFAVGDLVYFWVAGLFGYTEPFEELPVLSVLLVTVSMTVPMTAWMLFRGMPRQAIVEMSATMPLLASVLLGPRLARLCADGRSGPIGAWPDDAGHARPDVPPARPLHRTGRSRTSSATA